MKNILYILSNEDIEELNDFTENIFICDMFITGTLPSSDVARNIQREGG